MNCGDSTSQALTWPNKNGWIDFLMILTGFRKPPAECLWPAQEPVVRGCLPPSPPAGRGNPGRTWTRSTKTGRMLGYLVSCNRYIILVTRLRVSSQNFIEEIYFSWNDSDIPTIYYLGFGQCTEECFGVSVAVILYCRGQWRGNREASGGWAPPTFWLGRGGS